MRRYVLILIFLTAFLACDRDKPGSDILEPDVLVPVLVDIHLVYAVQSTQEFRNMSRYSDSVDTYSYVFEKHNINKVQFDSTIAWYSRHPEDFMGIYDEVVMYLSQVADSLDTDPEE